MNGRMTVDCWATLRVARANNWSASQLAQCFYDMPTEIAQQLLDGKLDITSGGCVYEVQDEE